jgi:hypothetical protein
MQLLEAIYRIFQHIVFFIDKGIPFFHTYIPQDTIFYLKLLNKMHAAYPIAARHIIQQAV